MKKNEENKKEIDKKTKEKKKLTKIQIFRLVMAGLCAVCLICGIVFTCIKTPIKGSIYRINTTLEEREETFEKKQDELFNYYDALYDASHYEHRMKTSRFVKMLYKTTFSSDNGTTKQLTLEVINFTQTQIKILGAFYIRDGETRTKYYRIHESEDAVFASRASKVYTVSVASEVNFDDYYIYATSIDDDNDGHSDWQQLPLEDYYDELERTKTFSIYEDIAEEIGPRPTSENESTEPVPYYMVAIMNARLRYIMCYIFAVIFLVLALTIRGGSSSSTRSYMTYEKSYVPTRTETVKEIIIKEVHHEPKNKKVICSHCGSRYKDSLDECPNCGSSNTNIEEEGNE